MLNVSCVCGRMVKDIVLQNFGESVKGAFTLAVSRNYKDQDGNYPTDFIDVVAWNASASFIEEYAGKGDMLTVSGRIQKDTWKDKEGNFQSRTYINAESINIVGKASGGSDQEEEQPKNNKKTSYKRR